MTPPLGCYQTRMMFVSLGRNKWNNHQVLNHLKGAFLWDSENSIVTNSPCLLLLVGTGSNPVTVKMICILKDITSITPFSPHLSFSSMYTLKMESLWHLPLIKHFHFSCLVAQSCQTLCNPLCCSLPDSSVHGIFQARILEWVAISSSRVSSWPRDRLMT